MAAKKKTAAWKTILYWAHWESRSFDWDGFGDTEELARRALLQVLAHWLRTQGGDLDLVQQAREEANVVLISSGMGMQNRAPILPSKKEN